MLDFVKDISTAVLGAAAGIGPLVIPAIVAAVVLLVLFARNSYRLFRVALPFLAALAGSYIGAALLGGILKDSVPAATDFVNPIYIAGGVVALVLGLLCAKFHKLTMFLVGAGLGALFVDGIVKGILWSFDFVNNIAESVPGGRTGSVVMIVGMIILAACAIVCALLLLKFFKAVYVFITSVVVYVVVFAIPAIFVFASVSFAPIAVLACAGLGVIVGLFNIKLQYSRA